MIIEMWYFNNIYMIRNLIYNNNIDNTFTCSLVQHSCRCMDNDDQIEQRIGHRCDNVLPEVVWRHGKYDIDVKCPDLSDFSIHHNKQFA